MTVDPRIEPVMTVLMAWEAEHPEDRETPEEVAVRALAAADAVEGDRPGAHCTRHERFDWSCPECRMASSSLARASGGGVEPSREAGDSTPCDPHGSMLCCGGTDYHDAGCPVPELEARAVELTAALREIASFDSGRVRPDEWQPREDRPFDPCPCGGDHLAIDHPSGSRLPEPLAAAGEGGTCHEDMGSDPCGKPAVGERIDPDYGEPYPVCSRHLRPPFTVTEAAGEGEATSKRDWVCPAHGTVPESEVAWESHSQIPVHQSPCNRDVEPRFQPE